MTYFDPTTGLSGTAKPKKQTQLGSGTFATPIVNGAPVLKPAGGGDLGSGTFPMPQVNGAPVLTPAPTLGSAAAAPTAGAPSMQDFGELIKGDSVYQQTLADIDAQRASDRASQAGLRQRALIEYGGVPDFQRAAQNLGLTGLSDDVTDTVRQLAQQNTASGMSTTARLQQARDDAVKATKDSLTARGLLSSGETGYQLGRQDQQYNMASADAVKQLLDYFANLQSGYSTSENARIQAQIAAANAAADRIPQWAASTPATDVSTGEPVDTALPDYGGTFQTSYLKPPPANDSFVPSSILDELARAAGPKPAPVNSTFAPASLLDALAQVVNQPKKKPAEPQKKKPLL